jgi:hypothetical protein
MEKGPGAENRAPLTKEPLHHAADKHGRWARRTPIWGGARPKRTGAGANGDDDGREGTRRAVRDFDRRQAGLVSLKCPQ